VSTPSNDFYGGSRPGANLFAESLVCLDAATGKRKWHYQLVHHGLWDYDPPGPPVLAKSGATDVVVQLTKMGFAFVFDRVSGKPVWPIEERAAPKSDVPGEQAWPTQPFPVKPPPFAEQGVALDDAFDLTPELKAEAQAEMKKYRIGPIFTPPSLEGTLMRPGIVGGANWGGGAYDPVSGMLFVRSTNSPALAKVVADEANRYVMGGGGGTTFHNGIPILKPPYAHLVAIDLTKGEIAWKVAFGDDARLRAHPALAGVKLPEKLGASGNAGAIVTKGGVIFVGGGDTSFHAVDMRDGRDLWSFELGRRSSGTPMTYVTGGRQMVVIASGQGRDARLTAFGF
jgi:quinoprotein glucose dehydrogenase